jgi:hypothetical protein
MFLIHAARVVNVCVDFANVVEITNRYSGRKINNIAFHITGEERATIGRIRGSLRYIERKPKRTFISVIS